MLLYVFDMFHILLAGDSLRDLWNVCMYVCINDVYSYSPSKILSAFNVGQCAVCS